MNQILDPASIQFYQGKRILITGAGGYLGFNLVNALCGIDCELICLSRKPIPFMNQSTQARIRSVLTDIRQKEIWPTLLNEIDIIFHFAAQTSAAVAADDPIRDYEVNVLPIIYMLECLRQTNPRAIFLFAGTVTQAGIPETLPVNENATDHPVTVYDLHKLIAEQYLKFYAKRQWVQAVSLRLANVYGPVLLPTQRDRGILNKIICAAKEGKDLSIYGTGEPIRDYVYIDDVLRAFLVAGAQIEKLNEKHFVIGSGKGYSLANAFELVTHRAEKMTHKRVAIEKLAKQLLSAIELRNFIADSSDFIKSTGWQCQIPLEQGIDRTLEALK